MVVAMRRREITHKERDTAMTVEIDTRNPPHSRILSPKTGIVLV
jgi:hypothetical protein